MNGGTPHDHLSESRLEENDPLWKLLAQAPRPEPDAWFAARTMARCRHAGLGSDDGVAMQIFSRVWRWALGGGLAVCLAVVLMVHNPAPTVTVDKQQNVQEAFEIMASIDTDSDSTGASTSTSSSPSSWQDSSL